MFFSDNVIRYDEEDEASKIIIIITNQLIILRTEKILIRETFLEDIESLTISTQSSELLLHYFQDFDERLMSTNHRDKIVEIILFLKTLPRKNSFRDVMLGVYFVKEINLDIYMTMEDDIEDGYSIRPE